MSDAPSPDLDAVETKLAAARTRLILDKPFLGALVLRLPMKAVTADWCPTTATDARAFYYNPAYIQALSLGQAQFMLAHEALHCALSHFARRQHRVRHRWDLACDFAINPLLVEDGLPLPPGAQLMPLYTGMTAEEIYPLIDENQEAETLDRHLYDSGSGEGGSGPPQPPEGPSTPEAGAGGAPDQSRDQGPAPPPREGEAGGAGGERPEPAPPALTPEERDTLQVQWQQRLAGAAQQALQAGRMWGSLARLVDHLLQPRLPWRMLLARYVTAIAREDFSYLRPSRREGSAILPSLRSAQVDLAVAVDTSGSVRQGEIEEFLSEIDAIKGQIRARVRLFPCDARIAEGAPWSYEPWEAFSLPPSISGGGGTDFRPVFEWLELQPTPPDLLLYFTDAEGLFPDREPNFPVLWLVKGRGPVPWGRRIQLN